MRNVKGTILLLLSLSLWCTPGWSQDNKSGHGDMLRPDSDFESDKCCFPAFEITPDPVLKIPEKRCHGTRWGIALKGECFKQEKAKCIAHIGTTVVTVHEYALEWKDNVCTTKPTGNTHNVEVDTCGRDECTF